MKKTFNIDVKTELLEAIKTFFANNREVILVSLCTSDGFNIKSFAAKGMNLEADKVAAMASTLCALSDSSSEQIMSGLFNITTIENDSGNMLLVRTNYLDLQCALTVAVKSELSLANARYITLRLANVINEID